MIISGYILRIFEKQEPSFRFYQSREKFPLIKQDKNSAQIQFKLNPVMIRKWRFFTLSKLKPTHVLVLGEKQLWNPLFLYICASKHIAYVRAGSTKQARRVNGEILASFLNYHRHINLYDDLRQ